MDVPWINFESYVFISVCYSFCIVCVCIPITGGLMYITRLSCLSTG